MSQIPQVNEMKQVIEPILTQAELDAAAEVKRSNWLAVNYVGSRASIGAVISAARAMADNTITRLSKNKKLRMAYRGFKELLQSWQTRPTIESVDGATYASDHNLANTTYYASHDVLAYVGPDARPKLPIAETDDGFVITDAGTFSKVTGYKYLDYNGNPIVPFESYQYDENATSSATNDGLVGPTDEQAGLMADQAQVAGMILDTPGKAYGSVMTPENYLTIPGKDVVTSQTVIEAIAKIEAMRSANGGNATALTKADLIAAGIPEQNIRWTARTTPYVPSEAANYKTAITNAASEITVESLSQIIVTVNA